MTPIDLVSIIRAHRRNSLGAEDGDLSTQRAEAMDHYHGRAYGNEVEGRSQVVSRDLAEAVDWALPAVVRAFVQSGKLAEFSPVGPEDEQQAQQESDYVNQVLMKDNPGFIIVHDLAKEAMLLKNCYVKHFWEVEDKVEEESYTGLSMDGIQKLMQDLKSEGAEDVEILGQDSKVVQTELGPLEMFDLRIRCKRKVGKLVVMAVPAEEVRVSKKCRGSLQDSPFTEHVTKKTRSELLEMGMDRKFVDSLPAFNERDQEQQIIARDTVTDESDVLGSSVRDRSMDEIEYCEAYVRVDYDGDGIAELRKVVTCANKVPPGDEWNEVIPAVPMSGGVIKRVPHRHVGESLDDELADLQEIQTALKRQLNDNVYLTNSSEKVVNERVNLRDMMTTTPGGIKRVKGMEPVEGAVMPLVVPSILDKILPVIDYWDKVKEIRTGIRPGSDMDPDVLKETTKGAFLEHLNRASQKIEMITRLFAETVIKEMVMQCHAILIRHQDRARMVQMRGKWVEVNPQEWKNRTDLTVRVGLGTGNEEEKRQKLLLLWQLVGNLGPMGLVGPQNLYALFEDIANTMGFDVPEKYVLSPTSPEFAQMQQQRASQPPPEIVKAQAEIASKEKVKQMELAMQQQASDRQAAQDMQKKQAELEVQAQNDARDAAREERRMFMEQHIKEMELAAEERRHEREMQFKQWQEELHAAVQLQQASLTSQTQNAATQAAEREVVADVKQGPDSNEALATAMNALNQTIATLQRPRRIVRGPDGKAQGLE